MDQRNLADLYGLDLIPWSRALEALESTEPQNQSSFIATIADTAAGYAALSLMPAGRGVLTTEYKINLLAPAVGDRILARGRVVKAGRTLTLAQTDVFAETDGQEKLIALLTATLITVKAMTYP